MGALAYVVGLVLAAALTALTVRIVSGRGEDREEMRRRLPGKRWS